MSGTDDPSPSLLRVLVLTHTLCLYQTQPLFSSAVPDSNLKSAVARVTEGQVPISRRSSYALSGTDMRSAAAGTDMRHTVLRACYAVSGTGMRYAATSTDRWNGSTGADTWYVATCTDIRYDATST
eukprot:315956-Rhodomonas_salina.3